MKWQYRHYFGYLLLYHRPEMWKLKRRKMITSECLQVMDAAHRDVRGCLWLKFTQEITVTQVAKTLISSQGFDPPSLGRILFRCHSHGCWQDSNPYSL